jgi:hypothetical protein
MSVTTSKEEFLRLVDDLVVSWVDGDNGTPSVRVTARKQLESAICGLLASTQITASVRMTLEWEERLSVDASSQLHVLGYEFDVFPRICEGSGNVTGYDAACRVAGNDDWFTIVTDQKSRESAKESVHDWIVSKIQELATPLTQRVEASEGALA